LTKHPSEPLWKRPASPSGNWDTTHEEHPFRNRSPGQLRDEFILLGVLRLIDTLQQDYNRVILNKNMEVCRRLALRNQKLTLEVDTGRKLQMTWNSSVS